MVILTKVWYGMIGRRIINRPGNTITEIIDDGSFTIRSSVNLSRDCGASERARNVLPIPHFKLIEASPQGRPPPVSLPKGGPAINMEAIWNGLK